MRPRGVANVVPSDSDSRGPGLWSVSICLWHRERQGSRWGAAPALLDELLCKRHPKARELRVLLKEELHCEALDWDVDDESNQRTMQLKFFEVRTTVAGWGWHIMLHGLATAPQTVCT